MPAVLGDAVVWAMPCAPFAGPGVGFFAIPPVGANVWVEFEAGDPEYPIWSGGFWDPEDFPATITVPQMKVLKTDTATVTLDDTPGRRRHHDRDLGRQEDHVELERRSRSTTAPARPSSFKAEGRDQRQRARGDVMPGYLLDVSSTVFCAHTPGKRSRPHPIRGSRSEAIRS